MTMRQAPPHWNMDEDALVGYPDVGPSFTMGGEEFHCMPVPPLGALPKITKAAIVDERGRVRYNALDLMGFIEDVLCVQLPQVVPTNGDTPLGEGEEQRPTEVVVMQPCDDVERWERLAADKSRPIPAEQLGTLAGNLISYYSERPTVPPSR